MISSLKRAVVFTAVTLSLIPAFVIVANGGIGYTQGEQFATTAITALIEKSKKHGKDGLSASLKELSDSTPRVMSPHEKQNFIKGAIDGFKKMQINKLVQKYTLKPDQNVGFAGLLFV